LPTPRKNKGIGGEGWIRTSVSEESDLQSDAINHSATSPFERAHNYALYSPFRQTIVADRGRIVIVVSFIVKSLFNKG
jgi:hypothetical protein